MEKGKPLIIELKGNVIGTTLVFILFWQGFFLIMENKYCVTYFLL